MQSELTKGFLLMVLVFLGANLYAQERLTISGYIKNAASGEEQIGASIYVKELGNGTTSNVYGFYSLTLPRGKYTLVTNYLGFETFTKTIELSENVKLNFELIEKLNQLKEVIVKADKPEDNVENICIISTLQPLTKSVIG